MIDIRLIRENPERIKAGMKKKGLDFDQAIDDILEIDRARRELSTRTDAMKNEQNIASKQIPQLKKEGGSVDTLMAKMKELSEQIKEELQKVNELEEKQRTLLLSLANMPDDDLESGGKENNKEVRQFGEPRVFDFEPKNHVDLCEGLGLIDYERGAKLAGSGSWVYHGWGSRLEWALLNLFIEEHIADGYEFVLPPHMLGYECGLTAGQFPKFADEVYKIANPTSDAMRFMLPTAETALVNLHRDEILTMADLPKKYIAYTPCYRREAGSYRAEERGMIRGHQFNKVEMVQYTAEDASDAAFEELVGKAERLVQKLGLCYRLSKLAAGDCSASMARTYDIEVWIPSMGIFKEVSSVSNGRDYQARRGNIRYRDDERKLHFCHTLNGSGLATTRIFPALVEQYQNADGSVTVPEVLRKYLGVDRIG